MYYRVKCNKAAPGNVALFHGDLKTDSLDSLDRLDLTLT
jgi:hypothetical protein